MASVVKGIKLRITRLTVSAIVEGFGPGTISVKYRLQGWAEEHQSAMMVTEEGCIQSARVSDGNRCRLRVTRAAFMATVNASSLSKSFYIYYSSTFCYI